MAKTSVVAKDPYRWNASSWHTKEQWRKWERVGMQPDLTLDDLELDWIAKKVRDLSIKGAIESVQVDRTIEGASTVVITLRDPHLHVFSQAALRSRPRIDTKRKMIPIDEGWQPIVLTDLIERAVDVVLDGVHFRLVKVRYNSGTYQLELTFEDRIIYWLRRREGAIKTSRAQVTRAEFMLRLLREIKIEKVPFICPELHQKQRIAKQKDTGVSDDPDSSTTGFSKRKKFTVKGATATSEQRRNMATVLDEVTSVKGAKKKSIKAAVLGVIVESNVKNAISGDRDSSGILQVRASTAQPLGINPRDIRAVVRHFMTDGYWGKGGAVELARRNPHRSAGWIAQQCQGSASPDEYDKWSTEANHWVESYGADSGVAGGGGTYTKSYQYSRDKGENSWETMIRLAGEVNWRIFPVGRAMYFMSEGDLFRRRLRHLLTPDSDEFIDLDADIDWGKPVNEMTMRVTLDRWGAPPGCTIGLEGFGPPDGRWLVVGSSRNWFSPVAELQLRQAGETKREPAAERIQRSENARAGGGGGITGGKIGKFYEAAKRMSDTTKGYGPQAHGKPLSQLTSSELHDCSSSVSLACYRAGMWDLKTTIARTSGMFSNWGVPGRGDKLTVWYNSGHVFAQFESGAGVGAKRLDTGGGPPSGPHIRNGYRSTTGFSARHWVGT